MVKVQRLFAKTNLKIPVYRTDQILFRNEGAHFQAPSGDGMRSAAFRSLSAKKAKKNRPNDHRPVLLFYRAANSSGV